MSSLRRNAPSVKTEALSMFSQPGAPLGPGELLPPPPSRSVWFTTHGTRLGADLRGALRSLQYAAAQVREGMDWIEDHGSALGCPSLDPADQGPLDEVIRRHTGHVEFASAADWPAAWDDARWATDDDEPTPSPAPSDAGDPVEPSAADRVWHSSGASAVLDMARLDAEDLEWNASMTGALDALCAALPVPSDRRTRGPARSPRSPMANISDWDKALCGAV